MLRLINDRGLPAHLRNRLTEYVKQHTAGEKSDAVVRVLLKKHGDDEEYYSLMLDIGALGNGNLELMLNAMGDRHAQMKAFLIERCNSASVGFFDDLML